MLYPTMEEVEDADILQLATWYRHLDPPGMNCAKEDDGVFREAIIREVPIINRITERFNSMGGFTPALSKAVGWD